MEHELYIWIEKCCKNDIHAQQKIYDIFSAKMYAVCLRYSSCTEDAQDNFQEGFIKAFKSIHQFSQKGSFEGWLRRIMVNQCMAWHRKNKGIFAVEDTSQYQVDIVEEEELEEYPIEKINSLIKTMPSQYRAVFLLYVIEDYSHKEIAEQLDISIGTSKSNLSRAKAWLRKQLNLSNI
ncbi:sigma-70 family RNA polymerase sigma factor [Weeksellaceae bacterium TAE3-ERU29]|nr:sigma-70 family RNA polymerase sigma factor [Weeksellaceae bacterium TAE3-ERU29]